MRLTMLTKYLEVSHKPTPQKGFLYKTPRQLQSKAPYKFCLVTIATLGRGSHRVVQNTIQLVESTKQREERRAEVQIQNRIQIESKQPLL